MSSLSTCFNMTCGQNRMAMSVEKNKHVKTRARLDDCENEKRQLDAQLATRKSEIRQLEERLNDGNAAIGNYKRKIQELATELTVASQKERKLQEQHAKEMSEKDSVIQELESKLVATQEENANKIQELQEQHVTDIGNKNLKIQTLEFELSAVQKKSCEKILELQEQHAKKLNGKDLDIQQLEIKLAVAKKETSEKELQENISGNSLEKRELSKKFHAQEQLEKVSVKDAGMQYHVEKPKSNLQEKKSDEPTQLHIDLGKLYVELQEAKKPQEALMAQLAAKDKEIEYVMEQHKAKLVAKDSEIQNLKEMIQGGDEMNENLMAKDPEVEYLTRQHEAKLAAKDQEITYIREQHIAKLAAKDSEIQRLTEMIQDGDEKNENLQEIIYKLQKMMDAKDREIRATKQRVVELEAEFAELAVLEDGRGGQSE
ncbi:hypothetical protein CRE_01293 [Caenorhabditis remanei]|uniref:Uncharacterized protein n=1 Tax=Caenorhabditis remanei TaxID=31234 RepID=E3N9T1_CAERE|nr:hypothetical protein CRE_01293 [Caenorhabditis remanei]